MAKKNRLASRTASEVVRQIGMSQKQLGEEIGVVGEAFSGAVRHVNDGDGLCVGRSSDPHSWIEALLREAGAWRRVVASIRRPMLPSGAP